MAKILIIDDDVELCELLVEFLHNEGFEAASANNGIAGLELLESEQPDLVIMDIMMPRLNGLDTLKQLRNKNINLPVIMLTARGDDVDKIVGLELGADDYLSKPFNPRELSARIKAILRRSADSSTQTQSYQVEDITINPSSRQTFLNDVEIELTAAEFEILHQLLKSAGQVCSKQTLTEKALSRKLEMYDRSIDMHISNLRKKLANKPDGTQRIKTVRGIGYIYPLD